MRTPLTAALKTLQKPMLPANLPCDGWGCFEGYHGNLRPARALCPQAVHYPRSVRTFKYSNIKLFDFKASSFKTLHEASLLIRNR